MQIDDVIISGAALIDYGFIGFNLNLLDATATLTHGFLWDATNIWDAGILSSHRGTSWTNGPLDTARNTVWASGPLSQSRGTTWVAGPLEVLHNV